MLNLLNTAFLALFLVSGVWAKEVQFAFHLGPPEGLSPFDSFLYDTKRLSHMEITADVAIPGLPVVTSQKMVYVPQSGRIPSAWHATTLTWHEADDCSIVHTYVPVRADFKNDLPTLYNELYQIGFQRALARLDIDVCSAQKKGEFLTFFYAGRVWTDQQLEEAVSEIGSIRALKKLGQLEKAKPRLDDLANVTLPGYALAKFLAARVRGDAQKYEEELGRVVGEFLDRYQKK